MPTTYHNSYTMFYAVIVPPNCALPEGCDTRPACDELVFGTIKDASLALKRFKGSRMKTFATREKALDFVKNPDKDESFMEDPSFSDSLSESLEKLTLTPIKKTGGDDVVAGEGVGGDDEYPSVKPGQLNQLRRAIEKGDGKQVEKMIEENPKHLCTVCDSAVYLMAGPKYNACHIAARANQPVVMALILDTISNISFMKRLYPKEADKNLKERVNHLLDSYLNTPDPRQGNTPLHFACKLGHYRVVRVLLTFEGCDLNLKDSAGRTAEESICLQVAANNGGEEGGEGGAGAGPGEEAKKKIKNMFKCQLHLPLHRDQLKKRLLLAKRRDTVGTNFDSDNSFTDFSDDSFTFTSPSKESNITRKSTLATLPSPSPSSQPTTTTSTTETMNKYH